MKATTGSGFSPHGREVLPKDFDSALSNVANAFGADVCCQLLVGTPACPTGRGPTHDLDFAEVNISAKVESLRLHSRHGP